MTKTDPSRAALLQEAESRAEAFRRRGYLDATVLPEYCVEELDPDKIYTRAIAIHVGYVYEPQTTRNPEEDARTMARISPMGGALGAFVAFVMLVVVFAIVLSH